MDMQFTIANKLVSIDIFIFFITVGFKMDGLISKISCE